MTREFTFSQVLARDKSEAAFLMNRIKDLNNRNANTLKGRGAITGILVVVMTFVVGLLPENTLVVSLAPIVIGLLCIFSAVFILGLVKLARGQERLKISCIAFDGNNQVIEKTDAEWSVILLLELREVEKSTLTGHSAAEAILSCAAILLAMVGGIFMIFHDSSVIRELFEK